MLPRSRHDRGEVGGGAQRVAGGEAADEALAHVEDVRLGLLVWWERKARGRRVRAGMPHAMLAG